MTAETKRCPWSAEQILSAANKCKQRGEYLADGEAH